MQINTKVIHGYPMIDEKTGASSIPKIQASTFHQNEISNQQKFVYSRFSNPTIEALEAAISSLENADFGVAFSSGVAAISAALLLLSSGDHIILCTNIYGGTYQIVSNLLERFNIGYSFVAENPSSNWEKAIKPNTKMIYIETPSNPTLEITDIRQVVNIAKAHNILTLCDNTFMTPYYQKPLELGVDIVIHSGTKFLNGHSDVVAGLAVTSSSILYEKLREQRTMIGAILGVEDSWLLMRGIKTLGIRMERSEQNALKLASFLSENEKTKKVYHPSLDSHKGKAIHEKQANGFGSVISFELNSVEEVENFFEKAQLPLIGVSLGGVESILSYPWTMSHGALPDKEKIDRGVTPELIRFSVGIEDIADLLEDVSQALLKE